MRMDRYEDEVKQNELKQTRTNKNQELYTDVYLNNVYVDINNLKDVMEENIELDKENIKLIKENKVVNYTYEDKNYDIVSLINEAIENKKDDNVKRNLDIGVNDQEIANLIESINENHKNDENDSNLLSELLPNNDNTNVIPPLENPILDSSVLVDHKEECQDMLEEINPKDLEIDDSFVDEKSSKKKVIFLVIIVLVIAILVFGYLMSKDII